MSTGKVVEPRTIVGGVTQKGYARASDLKARALRAKWEGFSQNKTKSLAKMFLETTNTSMLFQQ